MAIFVDTSALLAVLDADDERHSQTAEAWRSLLEEDRSLVTTNYVLVETFALVQRRLGIEAVRALDTYVVPLLRVVWLGADEHEAAVEAVLTAGRRRLSLVDCSSFVVMTNLGIERSLTLDSDFSERGFETLP